MAVFRVQLAQGEKTLKADLKAADEEGARSAADRCFDGIRWKVVAVRRLND